MPGMLRGQRIAGSILRDRPGYGRLPMLPTRQVEPARAQVRLRYPIRRSRREASQVETELILLEMPLTVLAFLVNSALVRARFARCCLGDSALDCFFRRCWIDRGSAGSYEGPL